jgi:hypothetical protein
MLRGNREGKGEFFTAAQAAYLTPPMQRRVTAANLLLYLLFTLIVSYRRIFSSFMLGN